MYGQNLDEYGTQQKFAHSIRFQITSAINSKTIQIILIVKWYDDGDNYSSVHTKDVDHLSDNHIDLQRAGRSKNMTVLYNQAYGDKRYKQL